MNQPAQRGEAFYLGNITNTASQSSGDQKSQARLMRFALQASARELLPGHRVNQCMRWLIPGRECVEIHTNLKTHSAYYLNLFQCCKIWECPVCASRVTERRRRRLVELIAATRKRRDGALHLAMLTVTIAHNSDEPCSAVLKRLQDSYRKLTSGRFWQAWGKYYFVAGTLRALEITHGNGWHPHIHTLLFLTSKLYASELLEAQIWAAQRWYDIVAKSGGHASIDRGLTIEDADTDVIAYVTKLSGDEEGLISEVTKQPTKQARGEGRSLLRLLHDYALGDVHAGELWLEGTGAMAGKKHLAPSAHLWEFLGGEMASEEEDATIEAEPEAELLATLNRQQWQVILRQDKRGEVLEAARTGDAETLWSYLESIGVCRDENNSAEA